MRTGSACEGGVSATEGLGFSIVPTTHDRKHRPEASVAPALAAPQHSHRHRRLVTEERARGPLVGRDRRLRPEAGVPGACRFAGSGTRWLASRLPVSSDRGSRPATIRTLPLERTHQRGRPRRRDARIRTPSRNVHRSENLFSCGRFPPVSRRSPGRMAESCGDRPFRASGGRSLGRLVSYWLGSSAFVVCALRVAA
jgi:hypothetical protein